MLTASSSQHSQATPPKLSRLEGVDVVTQRRAQTPDRSVADMAPDPYVQSPYIPVSHGLLDKCICRTAFELMADVLLVCTYRRRPHLLQPKLYVVQVALGEKQKVGEE